jgi:hypothetical protein
MTNSNPTSTSRVDLHCHSTASAVAKLGVQHALAFRGEPQQVHVLCLGITPDDHA